MLVEPFPDPSPSIVARLDDLRFDAADPKRQVLQRGDCDSLLSRPWDPASCSNELRSMIFKWLDKVVAWINEQHTWRTHRVIPVCWLEHPHLVHELAAVACLRYEAAHAFSAQVIEEWHRVTLSTFLDRVTSQLGETGCPPGKHQPSPGEVRNAFYRQQDHSSARRDLVIEDCPTET